MVKTRAIQVRLTCKQHERLQENAQAWGFPSISSYLRYVGLDQDFSLHLMVTEIRNHLIGAPAQRAKRRTKNAEEHLPWRLRPTPTR